MEAKKELRIQKKKALEEKKNKVKKITTKFSGKVARRKSTTTVLDFHPFQMVHGYVHIALLIRQFFWFYVRLL